jgi:hypothetical protein
MFASADGIELTALEVVASSRSDTRGLLGMTDPDGNLVHAGSQDLQLHVRIAARRVAADVLRALVERGLCRSPIYATLPNNVPVAVQIEVDAG